MNLQIETMCARVELLVSQSKESSQKKVVPAASSSCLQSLATCVRINLG
jgi:hypothetical protein